MTDLAELKQSRLYSEELGIDLVYGWFTEGFGTPDLKRPTLLDELAAAPVHSGCA